MEDSAPGRACPMNYRYRPGDLARRDDLETETLYVIGGLYGNRFALEAVLAMRDAERGDVTLVFNGDFHWFDADAATFEGVNRKVLGHRALRGNVETEIAGEDDGAGCGCAYPEWVSEAEVERSNRILDRLRETARKFPGARAALANLPMHLTARVGPVRVGIVHGDAESLAGWGFSQERLHENLANIARWFTQSGVGVFASSHTCLPVAAAIGGGILINNGAAGMPNFRDTRYGVITRIGLAPSPNSALYGTRAAGVHIDALPVHYDHGAWLGQFLEVWPEGSDARASYLSRILHGPAYLPSRAAREGFTLGELAAGIAPAETGAA